MLNLIRALVKWVQALLINRGILLFAHSRNGERRGDLLISGSQVRVLHGSISHLTLRLLRRHKHSVAPVPGCRYRRREAYGPQRPQRNKPPRRAGPSFVSPLCSPPA